MPLGVVRACRQLPRAGLDCPLGDLRLANAGAAEDDDRMGDTQLLQSSFHLQEVAGVCRASRPFAGSRCPDRPHDGSPTPRVCARLLFSLRCRGDGPSTTLLKRVEEFRKNRLRKIGRNRDHIEKKLPQVLASDVSLSA